jgi:hypothetical protein
VSADPGAQLSEYDAAVKEYHASRARYIRTVTGDTEKKLLETVASRRAPLTEEIANLTSLARIRFEARQEMLKRYAASAPGRVTAGGLLPPLPTDRNSGPLYKAAVKASMEFAEVNEILKKRKEKLDQIDAEVRTVIEKHGNDVIAALESQKGLEGAFQRDPLLERAYTRMKALEARREAARDAIMTTEAPADG